MAKIDYRNCIVGEFYPVVPVSGIGRLSFKELRIDGMMSLNINVHVKTELGAEIGKWEIIKIDEVGNKVLIISQKNYNGVVVYTLSHDLNKAAEITANCRRKVDDIEQILPNHEFEMIYVADSPLFFYLKPSRNSYLTASADGAQTRVYGNPEDDSGNQMMWYLSTDENTMLSSDLKKGIDASVLAVVSEKAGFTVDENYLKSLKSYRVHQ